MAKKTVDKASGRPASRKLTVTVKRKKYNVTLSESIIEDQKVVTASASSGKGQPQLMHFTWVSEDTLYWPDYPIEAKLQLAAAIGKELVKE